MVPRLFSPNSRSPRDERNFEDLVAKLFCERNWRVMPISSAYKIVLGVSSAKPEIIILKSASVCAGINRHEGEDERALRERSSEPLGPEFCAALREG
jgi:hypothetical protein